MRHPTPLPGALIGRPFTVREADDLAVSRSRLRRSDLAAPVSGVRIPARRAAPPIETPWERARRELLERAGIESLRLAPDAAISHISAAVAHGFPLSVARLSEQVVHVSSASDATRRRRRGIHVHPMPRDVRRVLKAGIVVTHPVDTWCALSALPSVDELVAIGDHLVCRQNPSATIDQLRSAVTRYAGRHGAKRLRCALDLVRERTDSPKETEVRLLVIRAGLPEPEVNVSVRDGSGRHIKLGDMVYETYRVLVEFDGDQHRTDSKQYEKDVTDMERAAAAGWSIIRIRNQHLRSPERVTDRIREALRAHGWPAGAPVTDETRREESDRGGAFRP